MSIICSVSASMATCAFNRIFAELAREYIERHEDKLSLVYEKAIAVGAMFDSRCFNIPREEVTNLVYWRQLDASRNSVQMVGHANFSQKDMKGKSNSEVQDMLMGTLGDQLERIAYSSKKGTCVVRDKKGNVEDR